MEVNVKILAKKGCWNWTWMDLSNRILCFNDVQPWDSATEKLLTYLLACLLADLLSCLLT